MRAKTPAWGLAVFSALCPAAAVYGQGFTPVQLENDIAYEVPAAAPRVRLPARRAAGRVLNLYSVQDEQELGAALAHAFEARSAPATEASGSVDAYLAGLCSELAADAGAAFEVRCRSVAGGGANAFTLPGGHVFVSSALLASVRSEAELAAVLAHEIGHVAARHGTRSLTRQQLWTWLPVALEGHGTPFTVAQGALQQIVPLAVLRFNRDAEREADATAVRLLTSARYDPSALAAVLDRLGAQEPARMSRLRLLLSDHPATAERARRAGGLLPDDFESREWRLDTSAFAAMQASLGGGVPEDRRPKPMLRRPGDGLLHDDFLPARAGSRGGCAADGRPPRRAGAARGTVSTGPAP